MKKLLTLLLLCITLALQAAPDSSSCQSNVAHTQVGVREVGRNNDGPEIRQYLKSVGINQPVPWCAAFVRWCFDQCHIPVTGNAWSPSWFPAAKTIYRQGKGQTPQNGDVFGLYYPKLKRIGHVGFIIGWQGNHAVTIEGNTNAAGSRDGNVVAKKRRLKSQIFAVSRW